MKKKHTENQNQTANDAQCVVRAPNLRVAEFIIEGVSPYVQQAFSAEATQMIMEKQMAGSQANKKKGGKEAKDFDKRYQQAMHRTEKGELGIPAPAFRNAMISACRLVGFKMTLAKLSVEVDADGFDAADGTPLVFFVKGEPEKAIHHVRLATGVCDLAVRAMWRAGWRAKLRVRYDADQFALQDLANLLLRAGLQVGIGCGRPDSRTSNGCGWGKFQIVNG
jgi:hypothetical protein